MTDPIVPISLRLAAFLNEALDLQEDLNTLAEEILPFKQDLNAGISTVELESSIGPAAFLIYHYELNTNDEDGQPGRQLFQSDLRTLERAATLNTPGPRILAHAVTEDEAYILATTPATHRALTGAGPDETPKEIPEEERDNVRKEAAANLLRLLSEANAEARDWLAAMQLSGEVESADQVDFHAEETGLALFLLDESNIRQLLQVLNLMVQSARAGLPDQNGADPV
ncbi:MAG: hypothetical protein KC438_12845 [Thermomicrobiales bacterium]|nr:hypothetical protein [Thermomicrobiales bacterium]MCO5220038.1 hypothetical protein [Thermomicrobiales bacterium]